MTLKTFILKFYSLKLIDILGNMYHMILINNSKTVSSFKKRDFDSNIIKESKLILKNNIFDPFIFILFLLIIKPYSQIFIQLVYSF